MTSDEFLELTKLPARTLRHYTQHGLLPPGSFGEGQEGYGEVHVLRVFAAQ